MDTLFSNYRPVLLYVDQYSFAKEWVYQEDQVPYGLLRYILAGSATFRVNGVAYEVRKDDVFYIPVRSRLECEAHGRIAFISARFLDSVQLPDEDMLKHLWGIGQVYSFKEDAQMRRWFEMLLHSAVSDATYRKLETSSFLNLICAALAKRAGDRPQTGDLLAQRVSKLDIESLRNRANASLFHHDPRIRMLVDYLSLNPQINLTRDQMCEMCSVSESTLRRLFKLQTGKTIYAFVKEKRMAYAAKRLLTTSERISDIGYDLGYESISYFTKTFRETFGISPQQYRKKSQEI